MSAIPLLIAFVFIVLMAVVGQGDYEEAKAQEKRYCQMVAAGYWPDYLATYSTQCLKASGRVPCNN